MFRLLKNLTKREFILIIISTILIIIDVALELKIPDYMSNITVLVQTEGSYFIDILINGGYMMLCTASSLVLSIIASYIIAEVQVSLVI